MKAANPSRELRITKLLNAPVELVWKVWSSPEDIAVWWGPAGFTTVIHKMEFIPGGEWLLTLYSPEGQSFANRSIYREIIPLKKIVFEHFNPGFISTIEFEARGKQTMMEWSSEFESEEMLAIIVQTFKADEGQKQNVEKLENYLLTKGNES